MCYTKMPHKDNIKTEQMINRQLSYVVAKACHVVALHFIRLPAARTQGSVCVDLVYHLSVHVLLSLAIL